jgi:hypothetical protein
MNNWNLLIIILIIAILGAGCSRKFGVDSFVGQDSGTPQIELGYSNLPHKRWPSDKASLQRFWGKYLFGSKPRPFYEYGANSQSPYPYQFECDDYARQMCNQSCNNFCYKNYFQKCAAGVALVDPEIKVGQCPGHSN